MRGYLIQIYIYFTYEFTFIEVLGNEVNKSFYKIHYINPYEMSTVPYVSDNV